LVEDISTREENTPSIRRDTEHYLFRREDTTNDILEESDTSPKDMNIKDTLLTEEECIDTMTRDTVIMSTTRWRDTESET